MMGGLGWYSNKNDTYPKRAIHSELAKEKSSYGKHWHGWGLYNEDGDVVGVALQQAKPTEHAFSDDGQYDWKKVKVSIV